MKNCKILYIFLLVTSCFYAQEIAQGIPKITSFFPNDYNGEAQNFDFIQDNKGVLYVANSIGFLEFNGVKWRRFKSDNSGIPISFAKDSNGKIYSGGTGFIGYFDTNKKGATYFVSLKEKLPKDFFIGFVWSVFSVGNKVYFKNDSNIIVYDGFTCKVIPSKDPIKWMLKSNDKIYINTKKGLYEIDGTSLNFVNGSTIFGNFLVKAIVKKDKNKKYIFTLKNGVYILENNVAKKVKSKLSAFLAQKYPSFVTLLSDKKIAISTLKGGVVFVDYNLNPVIRLSEKSGLLDNNVKNIVQDNQQNLWIGTNHGISKINYPIQVTFFNKKLHGIGTTEEITKYKNEIYVGTSSGSFMLQPISKDDLLSDKHFAQFKHLPKDAIDNYAQIISHDKLYFGGLNRVVAYNGTSSKIISNLSPRKFYNSIYNSNIMFVGHTSGCSVVFFDNKGNVEKIESIKGIQSEIRGVVEDKNKNVWLTSVSNGVYKVKFSNRFKIDTIIHYTEKHGLPAMRDNLVYHLQNNEVLFTTHKGLYKFDDLKNKFVPDNRFGEKYKGGNDEFIYAFNFDKKEQAWMHSFRKKEAVVVYKDSKDNYQVKDKGFSEINHMRVYEILSNPDKNIVWFGGSNELARYEIPKNTQKKDTLFHAVISKVISNRSRILVEGHFFDKQKKINLKERDIRFEVGATDFQQLSKNKFQFSLEGYDKGWSDWSSEPFKIYTNLNHGEYTLKVRARNVSKTLSVEDTFAFSILPKWHETLWMRFLFFVGLVVFVGYVINYFSKRKFVKKIHQLELVQKFEKDKTRAIIKEKEKGIQAMIEAQENERGRIARELHDGVVQQIGSVILKSRSFLSKMNLSDSLISTDLIQNLEDSNQNLRTISHQMMPRALKELGIIAAINDLLEGSLQYANINYSFEDFNMKERLSKNIEITIYRITQELISNIIKHSKASDVSIQLFCSNNSVILIVEDNGVGIATEKPTNGIGLLNISSRLDLVKGEVNFEPSPKSGTLVTVKIPTKCP